MKVNLVGQSMGLALVLTLVGTAATQATDLQRLTFTKHAAFFSSETKQPKPVDPHVFVHDPASPAATGPRISNTSPAFALPSSSRTPRPRRSSMPKVNHWDLILDSGWAPLAE